MIDSHAHLDNKQFNGDRDAVFRRAWEAGLSHIVLIGMVPDDYEAALKLAEKNPERTIATVGVHPHDSAQWSPETEAKLREALTHDRVFALGEIGLDWFRNYAPREVQIACFRRQLEIAREFGRPFVLHCRDAYDDCVAIIREVLGSDARRLAPTEMPTGVAHCFSGNAQQAQDFLDCGMLLSFAGQLTYKKSTELQDAARQSPPEYFLVETDCPYLAPMPNRSKRNEPAYVMHTAEFLANLVGKSLVEIDAITTANAIRLFRLPATPAASSPA